jgi:cobalt-precorrin 5A hydrolase
MNDRKPFVLYAITKHGIEIARKLYDGLPGSDLFVSSKLFDSAPQGSRKLPLPMGPTLQETFKAYDCHIFIISVGAVVRMIAPLLENKKTDPAVVCVDDGARFAVCLLSGHVGRGNAFTGRVAGILGGQAVVTTASDVRGTLTVDILGRELGWTLDDPDRNVTRGCAAVVNEAPVCFIQETGEPGWWPADQPLPPGVRYATSLDGIDPEKYEILLIVTDRDVRRSHPTHFENAVVYRPKSLVAGLGCDKGSPFEIVERGMKKILDEQGLSWASIKAIASIDKKAEEPAFVKLAEKHEWPFHAYPAEELDRTPGIENPSETVKKHVGTRAVAEPAALLASGARKLLVAKRSYREPGCDRSMTLAVARIPFAKRVAPGLVAADSAVRIRTP